MPLSPYPCPLRPSALLGLRAVAGASLLAVADALRVEGPADDLVANARQVLHTAAAHQHDRVLLQVVADAGDVRGDLDAAGQPHAADLAQRRVRLLGRGGVDARADAAALGRALQRGRLGLGDLALPALADQLGDRWHPVSLFHVGGARSSPRPPRSRAFRCSVCWGWCGVLLSSWCLLLQVVQLHAPGRSTRPGRARSSALVAFRSAPLPTVHEGRVVALVTRSPPLPPGRRRPPTARRRRDRGW